jgi:hypothetical protein
MLLGHRDLEETTIYLHLSRRFAQLRLPSQPTARYVLAAMLPLTPRHRRDLSGNNIPRSRPFSLTLELPGLRRNHAACRASLRRAPPPQISASSQSVRGMNPYPQPRISLVLQHARCFSVSHSPECRTVMRSRLSNAPPHGHPLCDHQLKPPRTAQQRPLRKPSEPSDPHTNPIVLGAASFKSLFLKRP